MSHSPSLLAIGALVLVIIARWVGEWWTDRQFAKANGCKPIPKLSRLTNIIQQLKARQHNTWYDMWVQRYGTHGHTFESASVSIQNIIFTIEPDNIKAMLATNFKNFDNGDRRRHLMGPLVGPGIFTNDGKAWEHSRALLRPTFTKLRFSNLDSFEPHFQTMLSVLPKPNAQTEMVEVDLAPFFFQMTLDTSSEAITGQSVHSLESKPGDASHNFAEAFDYAQLKVHTRDLLHRGYMKPIGLIYSLIKGNKKNRFERECDNVHKFIDDIIANFLDNAEKQKLERKANGEKEDDDNPRYIFLEEMAKATQNRLELRYEILNVLIAGRDTTAGLLGNAFFFFARHPDVWKKVRDEVIETFGYEIPDYDRLRNLKHLKNMINECLRLTPPLGFNTREATANTTLPVGGGPDGKSPVFVKKGQCVNYHVYAMHRLPEIFGPDSHEFRPSRWEDPNLRPGWGYIPFNGGARICLGQQFALTEASYMIVRMMQHFSEVERRDPEKAWVEHLSLVSKTRNGAKVALKPVA